MTEQQRNTVTSPCDAIPASMFRAYDIRGIAGEQLTTCNVHIIGFALGSMALERGQHSLLLAADARLSSPELAEALRSGLLASGCSVVDLGIVPTPFLYFATHTTDCDSGLMLTASHNPADYNGIKIIRQRSCLTPEQIQAVYEYSLQLASLPELPTRTPGSLSRLDISERYRHYLCGNIKLKRPLKLVVDCGNAVSGSVAPALFEALGCKVVPLFCEPDGNFPNHHPDPTVTANLQPLIRRVAQEQADLGIALDGDGDRVVAVSNTGTIIDTDRLLMLFVKDILPRYKNEAAAPKVVFDVKCSRLLTEVIEENGGVAVMSRSGHSFMKQKMQETSAVVGAEFSAHIFIRDRWFGYDDGLYVAARLIEIIAAQPDSAEEVFARLPRCISTPELRIEVSDDRKFVLMEKIQLLASFPQAQVNLLDGVRADFSNGWGLIRASNTTPALLLRFEAENHTALQHIQDAFRQLIRQADSQLLINF